MGGCYVRCPLIWNGTASMSGDAERETADIALHCSLFRRLQVIIFIVYINSPSLTARNGTEHRDFFS